MKIEIDYGFKPTPETFETDYETSKSIISSKERYDYTCVDRIDSDSKRFIFKKDKITCPICSAKFGTEEIRPFLELDLSPNSVRDFYDTQVTFENLRNNFSLKLSNTAFDGNRLECPFCGNLLYKNNGKREIVLSQSENGVSVKVEIKNTKEILSALCIISESESTIEVTSVLLEAKWEVFTLKDDRAYLSFENDKDVICKKDITENYYDDDADVVLTTISFNDEIKKFIVDYLKQFWDMPFGFDIHSLTVADLILLNRFKGFNLSFYNAIPFKRGTQQVDASFPVFKCAEDALAAFEKSPLFSFSSIKRAFFQQQGFFHYIKELEALYDDIGNIDSFLKIINKPEIYFILYYLHIYKDSNIHAFFQDFCKKNGLGKLINMFDKSVLTTCEIAKEYGVLGGYYKKIQAEKCTEKNDFIKNLKFSRMRVCETYYSIPMIIKDRSLEDTVDNYRFTYIKTTNQCLHAGKVLNNCLKEGCDPRDNVLLIKSAGKTVAAIEVSCDARVVQAKLANNEDIEENPSLFNAFKKWLKKHRIEYDNIDIFLEQILEDDDYDDLGFA